MIDDNIIRIAEKDIRTYLGQCDKKFNKYNSITLSFGDSFVEKGRNIATILGTIGIKVHTANINGFSGSLKFKSEEGSILNKNTGQRESRTFHKITLNKIEELNIENMNEYSFRDLKNSEKITTEEVCKNELRISDNSLDFYLGQCNLDFQSYDQLILSATEDDLETVKYLLRLLNQLGIEVDDGYVDRKMKQIYFKCIERERVNPKSGRKEKKIFYRIGITKVPELFMYTNPEGAIEIE